MTCSSYDVIWILTDPNVPISKKISPISCKLFTALFEYSICIHIHLVIKCFPIIIQIIQRVITKALRKGGSTGDIGRTKFPKVENRGAPSRKIFEYY